MDNNFEKPSMGPEVPPEPETPEEKIESNFEKTFEINGEELESIEGYKDLSVGQQALVLENLKQLTLGRIEDEAVDRYSKETTEKVAKYTAPAENAKFFGRIWHRVQTVTTGGWRGAFRGFYVAREEKRTAEEILHGGMAVHGETLANLVRGMAESGPEATVKETGEIEILYAGKFENLTDDEQILVSQCNNAARRFATIPEEWSRGSAAKNQQKEYNKAKTEYDAAVDSIIPLKEKSLGNERDAALAIADIDRKVRLDQLLSRSPDVEKRLTEIESNEVWARALNNVITERGIYMGFGYVARAATTSVLGLIAAPAVASIVGGHIARRRAFETLRQEEKLGRRGAKEEKAEIAQLKAGAKHWKEEYQRSQRNGLDSVAEIALQEVSHLEVMLKDKQSGEKAFVDATPLDQKIGHLLTKLAGETDAMEQAKIRGSLQARIDYTYDKLNKGLVNFGKTQEQLAAKYGLLEALSRAEAEVAVPQAELEELKGVDGLTLTERLNRVLAAREAKVSEAEKRFVRQQMVRGAVMGAGFATLGYAIRHFFWGTPKLVEPVRVVPPQEVPSQTTRIPFPEAPDTGTPYEFKTTAPLDINHLDTAMADNLIKNGVLAGTLLKAGFLPETLFKAGVPADTLLKAGVSADTVAQVKAEVLQGAMVAERAPADSILNVLREKFPLFAQDTTFRTDSSGVITREGYPGTYSINKTTGDLIYSGGTKPDGSEFPPQVLKVGSAAAEQWVEAPSGIGIKPEQFEYRGGKSIWQEAGKQWEARFKEFADLGKGDSKTAEALKTYNIDRIKDTVVNAIKSGNKDLIEKYGLTGISDPDKLTIDQLKGIKFNNVFEDTLKGKGLVENLSPEQIENITKNNATLREFFEKYPKAPRTSVNYEDILRGKGDINVSIDDIKKDIKVGKIPVEEITTKRVIGTGIPVAGTAEHIPLSHGEIISNLQESLPRMEETADQFSSLSMLEQEQILHSPEMQVIEDSMRQFRAFGNITDSDAALMGQVNEFWGDMTNAYQENLEAFTDVVRESTGLNDVGLEKLLGTKITDIWTAFEGKEKIFDFLKTVNPTSDELAEKLTVGEILKSRFTDGEFGGLVDKVLGEGWKE